jgi:hypothetical protein
MREFGHDGEHKVWDKSGYLWPTWTESLVVEPGLSVGDRVRVICEPQASGGSFAGVWKVVTPATPGSQFLALVENESGIQARFYEDGLQKVTEGVDL